MRLKEKIQPRRIVLEETEEVRQAMSGDWYELDGKVLSWLSPSKSADLFKIWKQVKETDIPLTNDEPKLSLSVDEAKSIFGCDFTLLVKIEKFIKENS